MHTNKREIFALKDAIFPTTEKDKNITFVHNLDDFALKICQKLPFSNLLLLMTDSEFFEFGNSFCSSLLKNGNKVQSVVLKDFFPNQLNSFLKAKNTILEFRAVIVFNKRILLHLINSKQVFLKIFYLQTSCDIYGIFDYNSNFSLEHYFYVSSIDKNIVLKNFAVRTLCLIDYIFFSAITQKSFNQLFFNNAKKLIICAITEADYSEQNLNSLFTYLIQLEKIFSNEEKTKYFSANTTCYLMQKDYYDLQINFLASKKIASNYTSMLLNKYKTKISFSERANLVSFFTNQPLNICLKTLYKQLQQISAKISLAEKQEIKSLLKAFAKLCVQIQQINFDNQKNKHYSLINHKLDMCVSVCGDTCLGINGMTLARQMSLV